jgi:outer membrane protein TolC
MNGFDRTGLRVAAGVWSVGVGLALLSAGCATREYDARSLDRDLVELAGVCQPPVTVSSNETDALTLPRAIERACAADGTLAVLKAALAVADARKKAATDLQDPELRFSGGDGTGDAIARQQEVPPAANSVTRTAESSQSQAAALRFFPPHPWIRDARVSAEEAGRNAARMDVRAAEWAVAMQVSRLFEDVRHLSRDAVLLDQLVSVCDDTRTLFQERAQARQVSKLDVLQVAQRRLQAVAARDRVRRSLRESRRLLALRVNLPLEPLVLADSKTPRPFSDPAILANARVAATGRVVRADLAALRWRVLAAQARVDEARAERIPWFSFIQAAYANGERDQQSREGAGVSRERSDSAEWRVDVGVTLPLFSWANHTPELRRAECRQAATTLDEAIRNAGRAVQDCLDTADSLRERQAEYEAQAGPVLRELETTLRTLAGETGLPPEQILAAREQLLNLQRFQREQDYELQKGVVALEEALGTWLAPPEGR